MERLDEHLLRKPPAGASAVIFLDLDRFKIINDTVGHTLGDRVLVSVASRLTNTLPDGALVARFGSDEYLVLLENLNEDLSATALVGELERQMGLVHSVAGQEINVTASVGVVFIDAAHCTSEDVLRDADMALHLAKRRGRHCHVVFDETMREAMLHQNRLERELYRALERRELYVVYQPIVSLHDRSLKGFEALLRWEHPEFGSVSPVDFIPLAEENGLIVSIGEYVLDSACRQLSDWREMFGEEFGAFVSVNVSSKQLLQRNLLERVIHALESNGLPPGQLKLEITESVVVENSELMISILKQFRALGVGLSMDDFGTGYSSLSYLHSLPIQTLKIDRSFVKKIGDKRERAEIVKTILLLARNLRLETVAEGIETIDQLDFLADNGCDLGQGYLFAKPLSANNATNFITESTRALGIDARVGVEQPSAFEH
jgi:diguanylate cyclase (GGDEF)-like protein